MKEMTVEATIDNIDKVTDFVNEQLEENNCSMKAQMQIDVAIDELFGNIAHYAYSPEIGNATVQIEVPTNLTPEARRKLKEFEQECNGSRRSRGFGSGSAA